MIENVRRSLLEYGFAVVPGVLDRSGLDAIETAAAARVAAASEAHLAANRTTGSMLHVADDPAFARLIAWPPTLSILRALGFGEVAWSAGYVISKPAGGPRLFWHQDWLYWDHPVAHDPVPHQVFAMYYLVDTNRDNGCLRVIPGSHRHHLPAHDLLARAHSPEALSGADGDHPMFGDMPGEIDVPVRAGDLLLGDSRLLHAAHANTSGLPRTLVTLWYHPAYDKAPPEVQAHLAASYGDALIRWPTQDRNRIGCVLPYAVADARPWAIEREPRFAPVKR